MEDIFTVEGIDKRFEKVSRMEGRTERLDMYLMIDVNTEIYPIRVNEKFAVKITPTLNADGTSDSGYYDPTKKGSIADKFEYIMFGKAFKIQEESVGTDVKAEVFISFGGLLMMLKGNPEYITEFQLDQKYYLCMRKLD